jgi:hypothetical protein
MFSVRKLLTPTDTYFYKIIKFVLYLDDDLVLP